MRSRGWNLASVIVATLLIPFLIHTDVKAQTTVNICSRTSEVQTAILAATPATDCAMVTDAQLLTITTLDLSGQSIGSLHSGDFAGLTGLTTLNLMNNALGTLPRGIFSGLNSLTSVRVEGQTVDGTAVASLPLDVTLKAGNVGMAIVEVVQGVPFTSVTVNLSISDGNFGTATDTTNTTTSVTISKGETESAPFAFHVTNDGSEMPEATISIASTSSTPANILTGITDTNSEYEGFRLASGDPLTVRMGICGRTQEVQDAIIQILGGGSVTCSGVAISDLTPVTGALDLSRSSIESLQLGDFAGLSGLTSLDFFDNDLTTLPVGIFSGLNNLTTLDLSDNSLTELSSGIFSDLTSLTSLNLSDNDFTTLPVGIFSPLTSLITLSLECAPGCFNFFSALQLPAGVFVPLTSLTTLNLSTNRLATLDAALFAPLTSLTTLRLDSNDLEELDAGLFAPLTQLRSLRLDFNSLDELPAGLFAPLTQLRTLRLDANDLNELPAGLFSGLNMLTGVNVGSNDTDPLPLNVTLKESGPGMAVVEVVQGVPFTTVTATLGITGGTFSDTSSTTATATISKGETESAPFAYTVTGSSATIEISMLASNPEDIENGFVVSTGYSGFELATGDPLVGGGICSRTTEVQTEILAAIAGGVTCDAVTDAQLEGITGMLELSGYNIPSLQAGDFAGLINLTILNLNSNDLTESTVPSGIFDDLTNLETLDLSANDFTTLPAGLFTSLSALTTLTFNTNASLTTLDAGVFGGLSALTTLNLSNNASLTTLPAGVFTNLTALTTLNLRSNALNALDAAIFSTLTDLTTLNLNGNSLRTLDATIFSTLTDLTTLDLGGVFLGNLTPRPQLPAGIFTNLVNLTELHLQSNNIDTLDPTLFATLTNLTTLNLSRNDLDALPAGIFSGLTNLTGVTVEHNPDTGNSLTLTATLKRNSDGMAVIEIPQGVPFTTVTATLAITGGTFSDTSSTTTTATLPKGETESLPIGFTVTGSSAAIEISSLSASENILDGYSAGMGYGGFQLAQGNPLEIMTICGRTQAVQTEILVRINAIISSEGLDAVTCSTVTEGQLATIDILNLSSRSISALKSGDFAGLSGLRTLNLTGNSLSTLPAGIFQGLTNLRTLGLNDNSLTALPGGILNGLTELRELFLTGNSLTALPRGLFNGLENLVAVKVEGNTTNPLPLNVDLQETTVGMAVVEIPQGVPFTSVTVNLGITGGTFGSGTDTTTSVTINRGDTRSSVFAFSVNEPTMMTDMPSATISITSTVSNPTSIQAAFTTDEGFSGFTLVSGGNLVRQMGICSRTAAVQTAILGRIGRLTGTVAEDCDEVTVADLTAIDGTLDLSDPTFDDDTDDITALKSGDFAGLTSLETLNFTVNDLTTLPADIFAGLTNLETLNLADNSEQIWTPIYLTVLERLNNNAGRGYI